MRPSSNLTLALKRSTASISLFEAIEAMAGIVPLLLPILSTSALTIGHFQHCSTTELSASHRNQLVYQQDERRQSIQEKVFPKQIQIDSDYEIITFRKAITRDILSPPLERAIADVSPIRCSVPVNAVENAACTKKTKVML